MCVELHRETGPPARVNLAKRAFDLRTTRLAG